MNEVIRKQSVDEDGTFEVVCAENIIAAPDISVIMSVYNGGRYVREALDSIIKQTYTNFECIIINDGSTDQSLDVLMEFCKKDTRFLMIDQKNIGLTKSLNRGLHHARGRFIARHDADDISFPKRFARQYAYCNEHAYDLIGCNVAIINEAGKRISEVRYVRQNSLREKLLIDNYFTHGSIFFKNEYSVFMYRDKFKYAQDYDLFLRSSEQCNLGHLDEVLYVRRDMKNVLSRERLFEQSQYAAVANALAFGKCVFNTDYYEYWRGDADFNVTGVPVKIRKRYHAYLIRNLFRQKRLWFMTRAIIQCLHQLIGTQKKL